VYHRTKFPVSWPCTEIFFAIQLFPLPAFKPTLLTAQQRSAVKQTIYNKPLERQPRDIFPMVKSKKIRVSRDIAPVTEGTSLQKHSGMARIINRFHSFTCTSTSLSTNGMNHTCLCLPSQSWSSFTDPGGTEE